jgi:hypothetical protein
VVINGLSADEDDVNHLSSQVSDTVRMWKINDFVIWISDLARRRNYKASFYAMFLPSA